MQTVIACVITAVVALIIGIPIGIQIRKRTAEKEINSAEEEAKRIINESIKSAESKKREALVEAKEEILQARNEYEREVKERRADLQKQERRLQQKEETLERKLENVERKEESYAARLTLEAKKDVTVGKSEMMSSLDKLIRIIGILLIPIGVALFVKEFVFLERTAQEAVVSMVAALIGMIPEGLYLLTSVALAVSMIRLAQGKVLAQDMNCIETLARVDVLCVDKTGTITEPHMEVGEVVYLDEEKYAETVVTETLNAFYQSMEADNDTARAMAQKFHGKSLWHAAQTIPFTSATKWSAVNFLDRGAYVVGAPEYILGQDFAALEKRTAPYAAQGCRVLLLAQCDGAEIGRLHGVVIPLALLVLENPIRPNAPKVFDYFHTQGVDVKVISGDNPVTVSAVAAQALAQLQTDLPNVGGVMAFFNGGNDLGTFAAGIVPFGAAMKSYGDAVADINTGAITASATAAQSLARLQEALPLVGGVMEFFNGSQDLAAFAAGIIPFGAAMKSYGDAVADIRPEAVESSASAGMALVELAKALPNTGGLLSFFTGGTDLASFGDDLTLFGADLSAYAEATSNVKADVVTASANAAEALSNLASGLPDSSLFDKWFGGDQTLASFGGDISKFGAAMKDYYGQISGIDTGRMADVVAQVWSLLELAEGAAGVNTSGLTGFADSMRKMGDAGISGFTSAFYNCGDTVNKAVSSMLSTVSGAVLSNLPVTNGAMETVVQSLANIVDGKVPAIRTSTSDMMRTMEASITAHSRTVGDAMRTVLSTAVSNINRMKPEFETAGKNAGQGFINGINSKLGGARSAGRSLGLAALEAAKKALDSHSPSREFIHLGENVGEGLAIGVNNSIVPAAQAASGMIDEVIAVSEKGVDAFEDWINEKQYYGELSLMDELAGWENLQKKYRAGSEERMKIDREVYRVQNELVSATYQASLDWIEEEKYYKRLSTEEELAAYERMQARYLEGSKERMELDRKVFTLRNQLVDESYQNSMDWIEEEKYYNRLSLADELAAYKRVQSRYAKGTEERKKLDREVYRLEQEIYEAQQQYIADVQSVQESANQRRIQLEEAYANKVKSINEQLERDIESLNQQYQDAVESRTKSLYQSYGLFDEVAKKEAVSSETLMQNLEGQVQEFGEWQDILGQLSARGVDSDLIAELQEMGPSAIEEIRALNSMSDDELEKYVSLWSIKHAQARDQATSELEGLRVETQEQIAQLRADAAVELEEYRLTWQSEMAQLEEDTSRQLASLRQEFSENVGLIKRDTEAKMAEMTEAARKILSEAGWTETGQQIPAGLAQGVAQSKSTFIDELTSMALAGVEAVKNTLEINSPSRVFRELGSFTGLGFVSGLAGYAERSFAAGADMADSAVDGLSGAIAGLPDLLSGEAEMRPTIRPVLDLSDLTGASTQIDSLFYPLRSIRLAGQASLAFQNASGENRMTVKVDNDDIIEELRTLRSEMAEMTERMERMRVVLDTGTLVGEMAGPMDNALGQRATRRGRGN